MSLVVIMLPCGGGFVHGGLRDALHREGIRVHEITGTDQRAIIDRLERLLQLEKTSTIILHGWSMGGGILLQSLSRIPDHVHAVIVYAGAGSVVLDSGHRVLLYHNTNDRMIRAKQSLENLDLLGSGNARLILSSQDVGGNNHQCNEFVDDTMLIVNAYRPRRRADESEVRDGGPDRLGHVCEIQGELKCLQVDSLQRSSWRARNTKNADCHAQEEDVSAVDHAVRAYAAFVLDLKTKECARAKREQTEGRTQ